MSNQPHEINILKNVIEKATAIESKRLVEWAEGAISEIQKEVVDEADPSLPDVKLSDEAEAATKDAFANAGQEPAKTDEQLAAEAETFEEAQESEEAEQEKDDLQELLDDSSAAPSDEPETSEQDATE